jgi:hypothetical protein
MVLLAPAVFGTEAAAPVTSVTPEVDGALGLPWGATKADVAGAMREKKFINIKVNEDDSEHKGSVDCDGSFAGYPVRISCQFIGNAMWRSNAEWTCQSTDYAEGMRDYLKIRKQLFNDAPPLENPVEANDSKDRLEVYLENQETRQGDNITVAIEFRFVSAQGKINVSFENSTFKQRLLGQDAQ